MAVGTSVVLGMLVWWVGLLSGVSCRAAHCYRRLEGAGAERHRAALGAAVTLIYVTPTVQ